MLGAAAREESQSLLRGEPHTLRVAASADGDVFPKSVSFYRGAHGFRTRGGIVESVSPGEQAAKRGVKVGWRVVCIDTNPAPRASDMDDVHLDGEITRMIQRASIMTGDYVITFATPPPETPAVPSSPAVVETKADAGVGEEPSGEHRVLLQQARICEGLKGQSIEERLKQLEHLDALTDDQRSSLLRRPDVVRKLLEANAADEMTVLLKEKTAVEVKACHSFWKELREPAKESEAAKAEKLRESVKDVDLSFADSAGEVPLHMVSSAEAASVILNEAGVEKGDSFVGPISGSAPLSSNFRPQEEQTRKRELYQRKVLNRRNHKGESPLEAILRRIEDTAERQKAVNVFAARAPRCLYTVCADGSPVALLLNTEELKSLPAGKVPWPSIREVLHKETASEIRAGYARLAQALNEFSPGLDTRNAEVVWTALLVEHCFGVLDKNDKGIVVHTPASRERLSVVWQALQVLLRAGADMTMPLEDFRAVQDLTKGLLLATRGPNQDHFDPREPYRQEFVKLIYKLQKVMATDLCKAFADASDKRPVAAKEVAAIPKDELHFYDRASADARLVQPRIRMDARLTNQPPTVAPLQTPTWVLDHRIDAGVYKELVEIGCAQGAQDIVDVCSSGSDAQASIAKTGMPNEDYFRFARLHAAWMRAFCQNKQQLVRKITEDATGIDSRAPGPWEVNGAYKVLEFRARSEAKGMSRLLEKMIEAIDEEVEHPGTKELFAQGTTMGIESTGPKELALRELLTPACYVCDVNGAEVVTNSFDDMAALYKALRSLRLDEHKCQVVRTKNGFSSEVSMEEVEKKAGYRDLKLWFSLDLEGTSVMSEVQVHLKSLHDAKRVMHLPYECVRGSLDHPHHLPLWQQGNDLAKESKKCCGGCTIA